MTIILALLIIAVLLPVSGCSSGGTGTPAPTQTIATPVPAPTPTPVPVYSFTPAAKTWPVNVTNHTYVLYKRTNNIVTKDKVNYESWEYTTLAVNNTTYIQRLVYNVTVDGKGQTTITDAYFALPSGKLINASRTIYAGGTSFAPAWLTQGDVMSFDLREMADWRSAMNGADNETVTVPAGVFDCRKYLSKYQNVTTAAIWMADYVPAPVRREMYGYDKTNVVYELLAYQM